MASTADNTLRRKAPTICTGDTDGSNAFDPALEWDGFAEVTFGADSVPTRGYVTPADAAPDGHLGDACLRERRLGVGEPDGHLQRAGRPGPSR